jgi:hypothetical protein
MFTYSVNKYVWCKGKYNSRLKMPVERQGRRRERNAATKGTGTGHTHKRMERRDEGGERESARTIEKEVMTDMASMTFNRHTAAHIQNQNDFQIRPPACSLSLQPTHTRCLVHTTLSHSRVVHRISPLTWQVPGSSCCVEECSSWASGALQDSTLRTYPQSATHE